MNEFTSSFWDLYISVITIVSILACGLLMLGQSKRRVPGGQAETTGHTWDEDLGEYNNPLPRWWMWLFWITIVFGLAYLALYPGLGSYKGLWQWTQVSQLEAETARHEEKFGPLYERYAQMDLNALAAEPRALAIGQKLFLNNCAQCHASDGAGSRGFPDLTDRDWLWGGTPEAVKASIAQGRTGVMPPMGPALGEQGTKDAAHYVMSLAGLAHDSVRAARGKPLFAQSCAACHGADGTGNPLLGAPNLADKTWLYGAAEPVIIETITRGRMNQMPAHKELLGDSRIHLLTAYVLSLSQQ
ncbi:MAG: cytochrome-c oxidase, cbb3-type subunit III [Betaproteobacteria bacterium]|nr:cytochrome-c oxidase, cbb3-type subunit III [Betaproteobacteria bacterium]MDH5577194.1 cytochrome-c oxidase, cbb3-type subunit III [Betaproteobacteria bacterium]